MTRYWNPRTKEWESEQQMKRRPYWTAGEKVLSAELAGLEGLKDIIQDAGEPPTADEWAAYFRKVAEAMGIKDFDLLAPRPPAARLLTGTAGTITPLSWAGGLR